MNYPGKLIKKGEQDTALVKVIQHRLNEVDVGPLTEDGIFGNKMAQSVKLFQARNVDENGTPLVIDGVIGAITWKILFKDDNIQESLNSPLVQAVLAIANQQIGVLENPLGSNSGTEVNAYLASIGLGGGYPWCMAFVYWCFRQAAIQVGVANPLVQTGGCLYQWNTTTLPKLKKVDAVNNPSLIKVGSVFIMDFGGGKGHTGIVESVSAGFITSIEGNTNDSLSREGIGVFRQKRKVNSINKGFILTQ